LPRHVFPREFVVQSHLILSGVAVFCNQAATSCDAVTLAVGILSGTASSEVRLGLSLTNASAQRRPGMINSRSVARETFCSPIPHHRAAAS
jgi:hypothetical protein